MKPDTPALQPLPMPATGGSFIRQADGTLVPEAPEEVAAEDALKPPVKAPANDALKEH